MRNHWLSEDAKLKAGIHQIRIKSLKVEMKKTIGAFNSKGFSSSVLSGELPPSDHLTYEGVFNELCFPVGPRATQ